MAPNDTTQSLDSILTQITVSNNPQALNHTLRHSLPKEARDTILASSLASGQDPLSVLDMKTNTLGVLYIMSARANSSTSPPPSWTQINDFCRNFIPNQARLAPERMTMLARGILRQADHANNKTYAIEPLHNLVTRYAPDPTYLTTIHPMFLLACVSTRHFASALDVLVHPITTIDTTISDLIYNDHLKYHYMGGIALTALKRYSEAEEYFEICVSSPGTAATALQMEALKKLVLVQLISKGKTTPLPKYTHAYLSRLLKNTPYHSFSNAYSKDIDRLRSIVDKDRQLFTTDRNIGLISQALDRAPRWAIKKLTATYLTLGLSDIGRAVKIESEDEVRSMIFSMIEANEICARISTDGTVTFSDPPQYVSKADVDRVLLEAQEQSTLLAKLEKEMGKSKDYLSKAVKTRDDTSWSAHPPDEEMYGTSGGGAWTEDAMFP